VDGHPGSARRRQPGRLCSAGLAAVCVRADSARGDSTGLNRHSTAYAAPYLHANLDGDPNPDAVGRHPNADSHLDRRSHAQRYGHPGAGADRHSNAHCDADPKTDYNAITRPANGYGASIAYLDANRHRPAGGYTLPHGEPHAPRNPFCYRHRPAGRHAIDDSPRTPRNT
jgi:hypothetical protein